MKQDTTPMDRCPTAPDGSVSALAGARYLKITEDEIVALGDYGEVQTVGGRRRFVGVSLENYLTRRNTPGTIEHSDHLETLRRRNYGVAQ